MRVVSVLPSATEIVFALGHGAELVGRSAECDYPPVVRDLPVVMRPRTWDSEAPSAAIDARVRATRAAGESLYVLEVEELRRLRPDVLLTQDLCGVCSVTGPEVADACARAGVRPAIVSLTPRDLEEVWSSVEHVAEALGDPERGRQLGAVLRGRTRPPAGLSGPRVAVVEWPDPPILAGLWVPEMVRAAGGTPVGPSSGDPGERTTWSRIASRQPDLVVVSPCSFSVERTSRELERPSIRAGLAELGTPPLGVFLADEAFFSRPGPRLADGVELVRRLLRGEGWAGPMAVAPWSAAEVGA
jgi:iron complex transport system substrate-binding protein